MDYNYMILFLNEHESDLFISLINCINEMGISNLKFDIENNQLRQIKISSGNDFMISYYIAPEQSGCEEQIIIPNILLGDNYRGKGNFKTIMNCIVVFAKKTENSVIGFAEIVSSKLREILLSHNGVINPKADDWIYIYPERWI
ncbi:MAG: hypothetical protein JEZ05_09120 [Tenericutes bacterium]|nr:hypothetical protein [Mycoplasmatota bacterium]